jgi:hypothetical protein
MSESAVAACNLHSSVYVSRAVTPASGARLREWSKAFVEKNAALDITGVLLTMGDHFVQMLEGDRDDVLQLLETIQRDPRHTDFRVIDLRPAAERAFAQWAMRCIPLDEKFYLGFDELRRLREQVRRLAGHEDAQPDALLTLIQSLPGVLMRYHMR